MYFITDGEADVFLTIYSLKKLDESSIWSGPDKKKKKKKYVLFEGGEHLAVEEKEKKPK